MSAAGTEARVGVQMRESNRGKRQAILDAAFQLFLEKGYEADDDKQ